MSPAIFLRQMCEIKTNIRNTPMNDTNTTFWNNCNARSHKIFILLDRVGYKN